MTHPSDPNRPFPPGPSGSSANVPAPAHEPVLEREALKRVFARATELQGEGTDLPDVVSESRMLEIAKEVGIDPINLRQALAEERARLPMREEDSGPVLDALGPAALTAQRVVPGTPADILAKLDSWMPRMESLTMRRRVGERASWEPRSDPLGNFFRSFGMGGRRQDLIRLDQVTASVTAIDATRSIVRFDAESFKARRAQRTAIVASVAAMGLVGTGVGALLALLLSSGAAFASAAGIIAAIIGGGGFLTWRLVRRAYREMLDRTHLRLEQLLDELEQGGMQPPPSLARQVTQALLR